jgi:hypothetical protein
MATAKRMLPVARNEGIVSLLYRSTDQLRLDLEVIGCDVLPAQASGKIPVSHYKSAFTPNRTLPPSSQSFRLVSGQVPARRAMPFLSAIAD